MRFLFLPAPSSVLMRDVADAVLLAHGSVCSRLEASVAR